MKKLFAAVLAILLVFTFAACGNDSDVPETTTPATTSPNTTIPDITIPEHVSGNISCPVCDVDDEEDDLLESGDVYVEDYDGWQDWVDELIAPNGNRFKIPSYGWIIGTYKDRVLYLCNNRREIWLCSEQAGFTKLSGDQLVINYTVAYDTIYWFNSDTDVWAVDWYEGSQAYLFCEDAIAVSPHTDEAEGAVVAPERANCKYYDIYLYSPYGE